MTDQQSPNPDPGRQTSVNLVRSVRDRARRMLLAAGSLRLAAIVLAGVFIVGAGDFVLRFPRGLRVVLLVLMVYGAWEAFRRLVLPALRFRPSLPDIALRIEREGRGRGVLASGVDLAARAPAEGLRGRLAAHAQTEADRAAAQMRTDGLVRMADLRRAGLAIGIAAVVAGGPALLRPDLARIGVSRTLWPFGNAEWPKRTSIEDATGLAVHPRGEALPVRALLTRTNRAVGATDVAAVYRVTVGGVTSPEQRVVLTSQSREETIGDLTGELFERLLDPEIAGEGDAEIEYSIVTEDDRTELRHIRLVQRPRVTSIRATVRPPEYVSGIEHGFLSGSELEVEPDGDGVAKIGPLLAGSDIEITLDLSKAAAVVGANDETWSAPADRTVVWSGSPTESGRISVALVDDLGLGSASAIVLDKVVMADALSNATVTDPPFDESVLATAALPIVAEGIDDLGMASLSLQRQVHSPPDGSQGAPPEPTGPWTLLAHSDAETPATRLETSALLDLASLGVRAGDEVHVSAVGNDIFGSAEADRAVRSAVRRLRIIDEVALIEQIQGELSGVRRSAIEIDRAQSALQREPDEPGELSQMVEEQSAVTQRVASQAEALERLSDRVRRNGLADPTLRGMLEDAAAGLRAAERESGDAARGLDRAAREDIEPDEETAEAQEQVREELESVIAMLDEGNDNWVARRTVESLLSDQRALMAETEEFGERTMGRDVDELTRDERSELDRIAARQRDAAERARQALESLTDRSELLRGVDPGQSRAMSDAASRGREDQVPQTMDRAAEELRQNQTGSAQQGQQAAVESLEDMLDDIDAADANRDETLRRVLAGVSASLEALITAQEREIDRLNQGRTSGPDLAPGMVTLATNTLGLLDEIAEQRDLSTIIGLVEDAADAQEEAVAALRSDDRRAAGDGENESLAKLREAKAEADKMDEEAAQRESARKRAELRRAYRQLLEQQVTISSETGALTGVPLDRRTRAAVRALGQRQGAVRDMADELRSTIEEIESAAVFDLAHNRLDAAASGAADSLLAGDADRSVARRQQTVERILQALIEAIAEQGNQQQFADQQQQDQGGGGGSGGQEAPVIPELAELKLLRAMQAEAADWTRNIDESGESPAAQEISELSSLQRELAERGQVLIEKLTGQGGGEPAEQQ